MLLGHQTSSGFFFVPVRRLLAVSEKAHGCSGIQVFRSSGPTAAVLPEHVNTRTPEHPAPSHLRLSACIGGFKRRSLFLPDAPCREAADEVAFDGDEERKDRDDGEEAPVYHYQLITRDIASPR